MIYLCCCGITVNLPFKCSRPRKAEENPKGVITICDSDGSRELPKDRSPALMASLEAFCDESGTEGHDLVIAGYVGRAEEWLKLENPWRQALQDYGLSEFKMGDCHQGTREFKGRTDRIEIRDRFLELADSVDVDGFAVRLDMKEYRASRHLLEAHLRTQVQRPYFRTFECIVQVMADHVSRLGLPHDQKIDFWFDQQDEFRGRALKAFDVLKYQEPGFPHGALLGAIGFGDSKYKWPLQTADMLAYLIHRSFRRGLPPEEKIRPPRSPIQVRLMEITSPKRRG